MDKCILEIQNLKYAPFKLTMCYSTDCGRGHYISGNIITIFLFPKSVSISFQLCYPQKSFLYEDFKENVCKNQEFSLTFHV